MQIFKAVKVLDIGILGGLILAGVICQPACDGGYAHAAEYDASMRSYRTQFDKNAADVQSLNRLIKIYSDCLKRIDEIVDSELVIANRIKNKQVSRQVAVSEQRPLVVEKMSILETALKAFNESKGESRRELSVPEVQRDLERAKERLKDLDQRKQDLKQELLEKNGTLPPWWTD